MKKWYKGTLHMELLTSIDTKAYKIINRNNLSKYKRAIFTTFEKIPFESTKIFSTKLNEKFNIKKNLFSQYVGCNVTELTEDQCIEVYKAEADVVRINRTYENIFQTTILAESAHVKASISKITSSQRNIVHIITAVQYFEMFLNFKIRDAGNENTVGEADISFRISKMLFRDAQVNSELDDKMVYHSILYCYQCFAYSLETIELNDERYLKYLYYSSLRYLKILEYIEDDTLIAEVCQ